ncbi:MAG: ABC transporter substrate binding protein [Elusimicrobiota bacterium]
MNKTQAWVLLGILVAVGPGAIVEAQEIVAVLSAAPGPYEAAYDSFQKSFGSAVPAFRLPKERIELGPKTRVVVAFGGEAAVQAYPKNVTVIACLAPGLSESSPHAGPFVFVAMKPPAPVLLMQMKRLQPRLKRLTVLWNAAYTGSYLNDLRSAAAAQGIEIDAVRIADPGGVPDALRGLAPKPDALWLAPDPELINPVSFQTIKQFSWDNGIPFYAPTAGLTAAGAAAAVSITPQEIGREDADLSRQALTGKALPDFAVSNTAELTVNPESAAKAGLKLTPEALGPDVRVIH